MTQDERPAGPLAGGEARTVLPRRPGASIVRRPLHLFLLADCSASMAADGKVHALNVAIRETLPQLVDAERQNPHAQVLVRAVAFSTGARWHVAEPTPVDDLRWHDLAADPGGYTNVGAALRLVTPELRSPPMDQRALPPALVLVSDGLPTDDLDGALEDLLELPWGRRAVRLAVGIGRDADQEALRCFAGPGGIAPVSAHNPEQLARALQWAAVTVSHVVPLPKPPPGYGVPAWTPERPDSDEVVW